MGGENEAFESGEQVIETSHICKKCGGIAGWDSYFQSWVCTRCGNQEPKPKTNADRIRSMTDEELATFCFRI